MAVTQTGLEQGPGDAGEAISPPTSSHLFSGIRHLTIDYTIVGVKWISAFLQLWPSNRLVHYSSQQFRPYMVKASGHEYRVV